MLEDLLQPTLSSGQPKKPMYSVTAHMLVAFFGGAFSLLLFSMLSLHRIGRLKQHWLYYLLAFCACTAIYVVLSEMMATGQWPPWLMLGSSEKSSLRVVTRLLAVLLFGIIYAWQRNFFSISALLGETPKPWIPALVSLLIGGIVQVMIITSVLVYYA